MTPATCYQGPVSLMLIESTRQLQAET